MFYTIPLSQDNVLNLEDKGYEELESCVYNEREEKPLLICINKINKSFFITDTDGIKDTTELVKYKFNQEIISTTLERIRL